jgi:hypothetical protein
MPPILAGITHWLPCGYYFSDYQPLSPWFLFFPVPGQSALLKFGRYETQTEAE